MLGCGKLILFFALSLFLSPVTSEALKRKSTVGDGAEEAAVVEGDEATPEKKAKLDATPEEAQPEVVAESEAAEVAA